MYWQLRHLVEDHDFVNLAALETIDLPNKGLLSGLDLHVWGVNAAKAGYPDVWLHDRLKKIEVIVDGSKVVKSLSGEQLLAHMMYQKVKDQSGLYMNRDGGAADEHFYISFGRYYHDFEYMLDLGKVNDPELRIETNFAMESANGFTKGTAMTDAPYYTITPHILREAEIAPKGYIKTSEVYRFTGKANLKENCILPRGPIYSNLYLQGWYASHGITWALQHVELNMNNDELIPMRLGMSDLSAALAKKYGLFTRKEHMTPKSDQVYPFPFEIGSFNYHHHSNECITIGAVDIWGALNMFTFWDPSTPDRLTTSHNIWVDFNGTIPFGMVAIPYFDPLDERFWVHSKELGDFWLRVELGPLDTSDVTYKVLADEVILQ